MSNRVLGKNVLTYIDIDSVFYPVFCGKTAELRRSWETIETTNVNSGSARQYLPGMGDGTVSVTGVTQSNNSNGRAGIVYLMQKAEARELVSLRMVLTDDDGAVITMDFNTIITDTGLSREIGQYSQCDAAFKISGGITYGSIIPAPTEPVCEVQDPLYLTLAEDATSVSDSSLSGSGFTSEILEVRREGLQFDETTGTPGNAQFKKTGNTISFRDTGNPGGERIFILFKTISTE